MRVVTTLINDAGGPNTHATARTGRPPAWAENFVLSAKPTSLDG